MRSEIDKYIGEHLTEAAMYGQLAEEAAELAAAAAKMARILRGENPTPVTAEIQKEEVINEYGDVLNCIDVLQLESDSTIRHYKKIRWQGRIVDMQDREDAVLNRRF